jgi:cell division protein FtsW
MGLERMELAAAAPVGRKSYFTPSGSRVVHETTVTQGDRFLLYTILVLIGFGLVAVYTASAHMAYDETGNSLSLVIKQALSAVIGLAGMVFLSRVNFQFWRKAAVPLGLIAIVLLVATMFLGQTVNGSERWIPLPFGLQFQTSDVAKIAAIALIASATSRQRLMTPVLFINLFLVSLMILLVYQQPNLSVSLILTFVTGMMLFVGGMSTSVFLISIPALSYVLVHKIRHTEYQWKRIVGWLNPWASAQDAGYNLIQSYYAISGGGLFGVGLGRSIQKMYYLPFQHTDFIFSVICEELGFVGALVVIGMFALLVWRGFSIAFNCPSSFGQMLALGITLAIGLQAIINLSVTIGLMPATGVTLPLISYGGTSMAITLWMLGILLNISRYKLNMRVQEFD